MENKSEYDVLRVIIHGTRRYMSADYIRGEPLIVWLKHHPQMEKEQFYRWIRELLELLENFHQCKGNPCYQYVNPYSIIMGNDGKVYLLDVGSRRQDEMLKIMQKRYVRENFLSSDNQYYQKPSVREDIYGLGKTLEYILSASVIEPQLKRREERYFQKLIERCENTESRKGFQSVTEIWKYFPKEEKEVMNKKWMRIFCALAVMCGILVVLSSVASIRERMAESDQRNSDVGQEKVQQIEGVQKSLEELKKKETEWKKEKKELLEAQKKSERELCYDLALVYFVELDDYQKSKRSMERLNDPEPFAEDFIKLCGMLEGETPFATEKDMEELLERMEKECPDKEDDRYTYCIEKGYELLKGEKE